MYLAHKIALAPNKKQTTLLQRSAGTARFTYNWALATWKKQYSEWRLDKDQRGEGDFQPSGRRQFASWDEESALSQPNAVSLSRHFTTVKHDAFPWMSEVSSNAGFKSIQQLGDAFQNFFSGRAKYPTFRKKGSCDRFSESNQGIRIDGRRIRLPKIGWIKMREKLRFTGKVMSVTISRVADRWFVSLMVDTPDKDHLLRSENQGVVGIDLGVSSLAVLSTGEKIEGPKPHKAMLKRLRLLSRRLSKKKKGSANYRKAKTKLARLHAHIANIRMDAMHKLTTDLTRRFWVFCIENLNVKGMVKNHSLARAISDMSFFEFRRQLEYKAAMCGGTVIVADRWFASSKICSACGHKRENLNLTEREWTCQECGVFHDRDVNAAKNLENLAVTHTVVACGEEDPGVSRKRCSKSSSMKQEPVQR